MTGTANTTYDSSYSVWSDDTLTDEQRYVLRSLEQAVEMLRDGLREVQRDATQALGRMMAGQRAGNFSSVLGQKPVDVEQLSQKVNTLSEMATILKIDDAKVLAVYTKAAR